MCWLLNTWGADPPLMTRINPSLVNSNHSNKVFIISKDNNKIVVRNWQQPYSKRFLHLRNWDVLMFRHIMYICHKKIQIPLHIDSRPNFYFIGSWPTIHGLCLKTVRKKKYIKQRRMKSGVTHDGCIGRVQLQVLRTLAWVWPTMIEWFKLYIFLIKK